MEEMRVCEKHPPLIEIDRLLKDSRDASGLKLKNKTKKPRSRASVLIFSHRR